MAYRRKFRGSRGRRRSFGGRRRRKSFKRKMSSYRVARGGLRL